MEQTNPEPYDEEAYAFNT